MKDTAVFESACTELEERTSLDRLAARGTVRLALKSAGLQPEAVTHDQMQVVLERVLPAELESRGIEDAEAVCTAIYSCLPERPAGEDHSSPEAIFARLGGD
ncbi:MAG: hypothetical protein MJE66_23530 [Proteobacteria bacterium]|nr:hypothetical protein [Pseudomonadota bacterium]